jgi:hypothetical protein
MSVVLFYITLVHHKRIGYVFRHSTHEFSRCSQVDLGRGGHDNIGGDLVEFLRDSPELFLTRVLCNQEVYPRDFDHMALLPFRRKIPRFERFTQTAYPGRLSNASGTNESNVNHFFDRDKSNKVKFNFRKNIYEDQKKEKKKKNQESRRRLSTNDRYQTVTVSNGRFHFLQVRFDTSYRLPVILPTLLKVLARLVFALPSNVFGFSRHFILHLSNRLYSILKRIYMSTTEIINEIKDYKPLSVERLRQIKQLSQEDKMKLIVTFDEIVQSLLEMILFVKIERNR